MVEAKKNVFQGNAADKIAPQVIVFRALAECSVAPERQMDKQNFPVCESQSFPPRLTAGLCRATGRGSRLAVRFIGRFALAPCLYRFGPQVNLSALASCASRGRGNRGAVREGGCSSFVHNRLSLILAPYGLLRFFCFVFTYVS